MLGCVTVGIIPDLPYKQRDNSKKHACSFSSTFLSLGNFGIKHLSMILTSPHLTTRGHCFQTSAISPFEPTYVKKENKKVTTSFRKDGEKKAI